MLTICFLFTLYSIISVNAQDIRALTLSKMNNIQYQCAGQSCSPSIIIYALNLRRCQMTCIDNLQCRTVTYNQSDGRCEMFADIPGHNGCLMTQLGIITMTAIDSRRLSARK